MIRCRRGVRRCLQDTHPRPAAGRSIWRVSLGSVAKVAKELGISESGLHRWTCQDDVDTGWKEGLSTKEREELGRLSSR